MIADLFRSKAAGGKIRLSEWATFEAALHAVLQRAPERREGRDADYFLPYSEGEGEGKDYCWDEAEFGKLLRFVFSQAAAARDAVLDALWESETAALTAEEKAKGDEAEVLVSKLKEVPYPEGDGFRALLAACAFVPHTASSPRRGEAATASSGSQQLHYGPDCTARARRRCRCSARPAHASLPLSPPCQRLLQARSPTTSTRTASTSTASSSRSTRAATASARCPRLACAR